MLMLARGSVWSRTPTQFNLTLVKMLLKFDPLLFSDVTVLVIGTGIAASTKELLVVADDVFIEHCDVASCGLQIQMAEQGCADMDR
jgi:hypothetical protein